MKTTKKRLDIVLVERGLVDSRSRARGYILSGFVYVNGVKVDKAGTLVSEEDNIELRLPFRKYVSRGGFKLEGAIKDFGINVEGKICLDIGASTGGFTDCLLQHGAKLVYAVDVGKGQLDWKLRNDPRVIVLEGINARYLDKLVDFSKLKGIPEFVVIDVSFISLTKILPAVKNILEKGETLALVKPQFELSPQEVPKGGVVKDISLQQKAVEKVKTFAESIGFKVLGVSPSVIKGVDGNQEYFLYLKL